MNAFVESAVAMAQQLTNEQMVLLTFVVIAIVQAIKVIWIGLLKQPKPSEGQLRLFVFVVSFPIGWLFVNGALPVYDGDLMRFVRDVFLYGAAVVVASGLVYDYVVDGVLSWVDAHVLGRNGLKPLIAP